MPYRRRRISSRCVYHAKRMHAGALRRRKRLACDMSVFVVKCGRRIFTYFAQGGYRGLIHQEADHDHLSGNACRNALRQDHRVCSGQTCGGQPQYVLLSPSGHLCPVGRLVSKTGGRPLFRRESPSSGSRLRRTFCANVGPTPKPSVMCLILFPGTGWIRCLKTSCAAPFRTPNELSFPQGLPFCQSPIRMFFGRDTV